MKVLLLGKSGQVGWELRRSLASVGVVTALGHAEADLGQPASLRPLVRAHRPDVIVNAAAYTAVDRAESDPETAMRVNGEAVGVLGECAADLGALMVHFSTDYVFDGSGSRPWREDDAVSPLNAYGRSKLEGERALAHAGCRHVVFRTSWVYAARGQNFVRTMLRLAGERDSLRVVSDQFGVPTPAALLADLTARAIERCVADRGALSGTYHLCPRGETTWHGVAVAALRAALDAGASLRCTPDRVSAVTSDEFPTPARRPFNSRLSVERIERALGIRLPEWHEPLPAVVAALLGEAA
jgi:dTDP-4-dehydrorhamnose reductase